VTLSLNGGATPWTCRCWGGEPLSSGTHPVPLGDPLRGSPPPRSIRLNRSRQTQLPPEERAFSYSNDEMEEANAAGMVAADAILLGRVTYQEFASYWPYQNSADQPYTDYLNNTPKFVASTTLEEPPSGRTRR
jgi:hypothetical protein